MENRLRGGKFIKGYPPKSPASVPPWPPRVIGPTATACYRTGLPCGPIMRISGNGLVGNGVSAMMGCPRVVRGMGRKCDIQRSLMTRKGIMGGRSSAKSAPQVRGSVCPTIGFLREGTVTDRSLRGAHDARSRVSPSRFLPPRDWGVGRGSATSARKVQCTPACSGGR